jgi:pentapeptide repeat protein
MPQYEIKKLDGSVIWAGPADSFKLAVVSANLSRANLSGADLSGADLSGADLSRADLSGADLSRANLYGADLSRANLYCANLSGANLYGANLYGANLSGADLSRANLYGAYLSYANLSRADLSGADLSRANLYGAYLSGAIGILTDTYNQTAADPPRTNPVPNKLKEKKRFPSWYSGQGCASCGTCDYNGNGPTFKTANFWDIHSIPDHLKDMAQWDDREYWGAWGIPFCRDCWRMRNTKTLELREKYRIPKPPLSPNHPRYMMSYVIVNAAGRFLNYKNWVVRLDEAQKFDRFKLAKAALAIAKSSTGHPAQIVANYGTNTEKRFGKAPRP